VPAATIPWTLEKRIASRERLPRASTRTGGTRLDGGATNKNVDATAGGIDATNRNVHAPVCGLGATDRHGE